MDLLHVGVEYELAVRHGGPATGLVDTVCAGSVQSPSSVVILPLYNGVNIILLRIFNIFLVHVRIRLGKRILLKRERILGPWVGTKRDFLMACCSSWFGRGRGSSGTAPSTRVTVYCSTVIGNGRLTRWLHIYSIYISTDWCERGVFMCSMLSIYKLVFIMLEFSVR